MKQKILLWKPEEYQYPGAGKFIPFLMAYLHEDAEARPAMIVVPGGGFYCMDPMEAGVASNMFYNMGYNTFVLVYTNNVTMDKPIINQAPADALRAVQVLRKNHETYHIVPDQIYAVGFSAGGYIVTSMATRFDAPEYRRDDEYSNVSNRPDAVVATYGMLTCASYNPGFGLDNLLGKNASPSEIKKHSLDLCVTRTASPIFLLHGTADVVVSAKNALDIASAYAEQNVPYELHLLLGCNHHVFVTTDYAPESNEDASYVYEQLYETIEAMTDEELVGYSELYPGVKKGMIWEAFTELVTEIRMRIIPPKMFDAPIPDNNLSYMTVQNPNAEHWGAMVDRWLKMLSPSSWWYAKTKEKQSNGLDAMMGMSEKDREYFRMSVPDIGEPYTLSVESREQEDII